MGIDITISYINSFFNYKNSYLAHKNSSRTDIYSLLFKLEFIVLK